MADIAAIILEYLDRPEYQPLAAAALAKELHVTKKHAPAFREALRTLIDAGTVRKTKAGLARKKAGAGLISGMIKRTAAGVGFLLPKGAVGREQEIYIGREDIADAQSGDEVLVALKRGPARPDGRLRGRIVEIIERATHTFVGTYLELDGSGFVQVDGKTFSDPISVGDPGAKGARPDDKVVIEMVRFPSHLRPGEAVLIEVLGPRGQPGVDTLTVIHEFGLPDAFPEPVLDEARVMAEQFDEAELGGRLDLTGETIITIDPVDARDFDDAISLDRSADGHWHLGVHIADVAHFVRPNSALDHEAQRRGTSVYLPDRVLPMLPEVLSNALASLQQGKVRFTKSVQIELDAAGVPIHSSFANSAIKVMRRFAYEEVMPIIEDPERFKTRVSAKVRALLARMYELAMLMRKRRFVGGALELTMPEVKLRFDAEGKIAGAQLAPHDASHEIIEEFMLAANMAVARALSDRGVVFLRRVHGNPDEVKLRAFKQFVESLGFPLKLYQSRKALQDLLDKVKDQPTMHAVNYALLRSMKQAEYSVDDVGHYALAVENYCHFTSPIRRYPDLTVHRLIGALAAGESFDFPGMLETLTLAKHCSMTERRAADAERELVKIKLLTYMAERIGEQLDAVITGVQDFGFFCQGIEIPAEGLVHVSSLADDYYYFEAASHSLIGRRSGRQYRLGDRLRVEVARVDVDRRALDFRVVLTGKGKSPKGPAGSSPPASSPADAAPARRGRQGDPTEGPAGPPLRTPGRRGQGGRPKKTKKKGR